MDCKRSVRRPLISGSYGSDAVGAYECSNIKSVEFLPRGSVVSGLQSTGTSYWGKLGKASRGKSLKHSAGWTKLKQQLEEKYN